MRPILKMRLSQKLTCLTYGVQSMGVTVIQRNQFVFADRKRDGDSASGRRKQKRCIHKLQIAPADQSAPRPAGALVPWLGRHNLNARVANR